MPNSVTYLKHRPIFEWFVASWGSKNNFQKDICIYTRLDCMLYNQHNYGDLYVNLTTTKTFTLIMNKTSI